MINSKSFVAIACAAIGGLSCSPDPASAQALLSLKPQSATQCDELVRTRAMRIEEGAPYRFYGIESQDLIVHPIEGSAANKRVNGMYCLFHAHAGAIGVLETYLRGAARAHELEVVEFGKLVEADPSILTTMQAPELRKMSKAARLGQDYAMASLILLKAMYPDEGARSENVKAMFDRSTHYRDHLNVLRHGFAKQAGRYKRMDNPSGWYCTGKKNGEGFTLPQFEKRVRAIMITTSGCTQFLANSLAGKLDRDRKAAAYDGPRISEAW